MCCALLFIIIFKAKANHNKAISRREILSPAYSVGLSFFSLEGSLDVLAYANIFQYKNILLKQHSTLIWEA